ncbi:hypothetical protein TTHERM_02094560 (macronuclear) [Tetrahymena thermophila SB210]|uniref:Transmembrane protein n=1 Tax=Tetrahymena thermophila (strain SB210) TaxID=312017 RepID=Q226C2_TETTS|nr:hypothetical protein TTHERM_02094560 [Tetrahymena thermophila SB210]EAR81138.2 hypothetical protein TTHERM_02094560 [Tetrahymena thermophila SB210]|eukprot:XP_001028801.2 hypothetical protein TTHERM_02094560 [Tetrahymena thermophila SB210]
MVICLFSLLKLKFIIAVSKTIQFQTEEGFTLSLFNNLSKKIIIQKLNRPISLKTQLIIMEVDYIQKRALLQFKTAHFLIIKPIYMVEHYYIIFLIIKQLNNYLITKWFYQRTIFFKTKQVQQEHTIQFKAYFLNTFTLITLSIKIKPTYLEKIQQDMEQVSKQLLIIQKQITRILFILTQLVNFRTLQLQKQSIKMERFLMIN